MFAPISPKPMIINAQLAGSGIADIDRLTLSSPATLSPNGVPLKNPIVVKFVEAIKFVLNNFQFVVNGVVSLFVKEVKAPLLSDRFTVLGKV
jgi:hypothetical protein